MMIEALNKLVEDVAKEEMANRFPIAKALIKGKTVEACIVKQFRCTTGRKQQKPSIMWKVNGKRVAAKDLTSAIEE